MTNISLLKKAEEYMAWETNAQGDRFRTLGYYATTLRKGGLLAIFNNQSIVPLGYHPNITKAENNLLLFPEFTENGCLEGTRNPYTGTVEIARRTRNKSVNRCVKGLPEQMTLYRHTISEAAQIRERFKTAGLEDVKFQQKQDELSDTAYPVRTLDTEYASLSSIHENPDKSNLAKKLRRICRKELTTRGARIVIARKNVHFNEDNIQTDPQKPIPIEIGNTNLVQRKIKEFIAPFSPVSEQEKAPKDNLRYDDFAERVIQLGFDSPITENFNAFVILDAKDNILAYSLWEHSTQDISTAIALTGGHDRTITSMAQFRYCLMCEILNSNESVTNLCLGGSEHNAEGLDELKKSLPQYDDGVKLLSPSKLSFPLDGGLIGRKDPLAIDIIPLSDNDKNVEQICRTLRALNLQPNQLSL